MKRRRNKFNPKRKILPADQLDVRETERFAKEAVYRGNPEHKLHPGDYGLTPPAAPRPGKTTCDAGGEFPKHMAAQLLSAGFLRGMISERRRGGWPQNVWAVSKKKQAFEAQLENQSTGEYHGYPMPSEDDFRETILSEWDRRG